MASLRLPKAGTIEVVPSILSADFAHLADEITEIEAAGMKMIHLDIMDGHFVPNITIGPPVVEKLRRCSNLIFDCHLMITEPARYAEAFIKAGANHITFHAETTDEPVKLIDELHKMGVTAGVSINPETPVSTIENVIGFCDMILIMTVHPGFGAQKFIEDAAKKILQVKRIARPETRVEVDGGIDPQTTPIVVSLGADTLVAGNAIFSEPSRLAAINAILAAAK